MPMLVILGQQLLAASPAPSAPESTGHVLHLIAKAYKISIVADLSPHQASQESIVQWGTFLLQIVCRVIPDEAQPEDKDDREKWSWWKAKKWAHHVVRQVRQVSIVMKPILKSDLFCEYSSTDCTTLMARQHNCQAIVPASSRSQRTSKLTSLPRS